MAESTWNGTETTEAREQALWGEAAAWENEDDYWDESFVDEDEEEAFTLARKAVARSTGSGEKRAKNSCASRSNHALY